MSRSASVGRRAAMAALVIVGMLFGGARAQAAIALITFAKTSDGSTLSGNMTLNMPASVPAGVVCLAHLATSGDNIITSPAGWKRIREDINGHQATQGLYWHLSNSSEAASYTWTTGGGVYYEGVIACYSGANTSTPIDPGAPKGSGPIGSGINITAPSITTQTTSNPIVGAFQVTESTWGQGVTINLPGALTPRWSFTDADADFVATASRDQIHTTAGAPGALPIPTNRSQPADSLLPTPLPPPS